MFLHNHCTQNNKSFQIKIHNSRFSLVGGAATIGCKLLLAAQRDKSLNKGYLESTNWLV